MAGSGDDQRNPVDELVDLFVYAPIGMLYEYDEVIPRLIKRGKSQVQVARLLGRMAMSGTGQDVMGKVAGGVASSVAKQITEVGAAIGLAPPTETDRERSPAPPPPGPGSTTDSPPPPPHPSPPAVEAVQAAEAVEAAQDEADEALEDQDPAEAPQLPIAGYDDLTAKEIIGLLDDLSPAQRDRVRSHEQANRARKTVLGKLDRLAG
jgi:hypothetical protein